LSWLRIHGRHYACDILPDRPALFHVLGLGSGGAETERAQSLAPVGNELGQIGLRLIGYVLHLYGFHVKNKLNKAA
jgi:hypothetical protein